MDMDNTAEAVKKYWVWALAALAGFWLITRNTGAGDSSGDTSGSLYDPNLLANNLAMTQVAATVQQAQITADAQNNLAGWQTISQGFSALGIINQDFQAGQIAGYQAVKDISINAANSMATITGAGLLAAGETTAAFHKMVESSTGASAQIVSAVGASTSSSQNAFGNLAGKALFAFI